MKATIYNRLNGDTVASPAVALRSGEQTLEALLPGGYHDTDHLPTSKLTWDILPDIVTVDAFGVPEMFAVGVWGASVPDGAEYGEERHTLEIWIYEPDGNVGLDKSANRIKRVMHRWKPTNNEDLKSIMEIKFFNESREFIDPDLGDLNGRIIRFTVRTLDKNS